MGSQISNIKSHFDALPYDSLKTLYEFKNNIHYNKFFNNIDYLNANSSFVKFNNYTWDMRPDVFCNDYYKESNLFPIVLLVNNIGSVFNFRSDQFFEETIIAPSKSSIIKILSIR